MKKTARNDVTGDLLRSKPANDMFEQGWDRIFGKKKKPMSHEKMVKKMLENPKVLAEYELDDGQLTEEQYAKIKELAEYELNKSTGEVQKKDINGN